MATQDSAGADAASRPRGPNDSTPKHGRRPSRAKTAPSSRPQESQSPRHDALRMQHQQLEQLLRQACEYEVKSGRKLAAFQRRLDVLVEERDQFLQSFKKILFQMITRNDDDGSYWSDASYDRQIESEDEDEDIVAQEGVGQRDSITIANKPGEDQEERENTLHASVPGGEGKASRSSAKEVEAASNANVYNTRTNTPRNVKGPVQGRGSSIGEYGQTGIDVSDKPSDENVATPTPARPHVGRGPQPDESLLANETSRIETNTVRPDVIPPSREIPADTKRPEVRETPAMDKGTPKKRGHWTDEEQECCIKLVRDLMKEFGDTIPRTELWRQVSEGMQKSGYDRPAAVLMAKWSAEFRDKCMNRGDDWAESVMKKVHRVRKRTMQSGDGLDSDPNTTPASAAKVKRVKKQSRPKDYAPKSDSLHHDPQINGSPGVLEFCPADKTRTSDAPAGNGDDAKKLRPWIISTPAAKDIVEVACSPDGNHFAVASTKADDDSSANRSRNLLLGTLESPSIEELPYHRERYQGSKLPGSQYVYPTVSSVQFIEDGRYLVSAGWDRIINIFDIKNQDDTTPIRQIPHHKELLTMAVCEGNNRLIATAADNGTVYLDCFESDFGSGGYSTTRPLEGVENFDYYPSCLRFAKCQNQTLLLAGFLQITMDESSSSKGGCKAWQCAPDRLLPLSFSCHSTCVFDIAVSPVDGIFATALASNLSDMPDKFGKTVVQLYNATQHAPIRSLSCPALDINDVTFSPHSEFYITASCTNGSTYVWDLRKTEKPTHVLSHGPSVHDLDPNKPREVTDVGARHIDWGNEDGHLYTGGSDGLVKHWNVRLSQENAWVEDVDDVDIGVNCGKFSADYSSLLVGDDDGRLHVYR